MFFEVLSIPPIPCLDRDSQGLRIVSGLSSLAKETLVDLSESMVPENPGDDHQFPIKLARNTAASTLSPHVVGHIP
jgi:hypothetical protein